MMPKNSQTAQTLKQSASPARSTTSPMPAKKVYSREFNLETLQLLKSSGKTMADLERELGLYPGQIHLWERAFNKEGGNLEQAFPGVGHPFGQGSLSGNSIAWHSWTHAHMAVETTNFLDRVWK